MRVSEIAKTLDGKVIGDDSIEITSLCKIDQSETGGLTFLSNPSYRHFLESTKAVVLVDSSISNTNTTVIQVKDPYLAFVKALTLFHKEAQPFPIGTDSRAVVDPTAKIGKNCRIAANVFIGKHVTIGDDTIIYPNSTIMDDCQIGNHVRIYSNVSIREGCILGNNVTIHNGAVIGSDGFGYAPDVPNGYQKILQVGIVRLEDNVDIGANAVIDRATIGETLIKKGTKIDNMVQIAHNVVIGENNVIAALTGIAGSTQIGNWNQIGGHVAITGHIKIGNQNKLSGDSGIAGHIGDNEHLMGTPAMDAKVFRRLYASHKYLPELVKTMRKLKKIFAKELNSEE
ncbi:MAG: UDP-3-O-(3-hydroxymyristoyl)glucosamine N-acyltransferase [Calditrichaeota bacterium]|nr:UDP-3-O-(3-hydroxymyristoyl)glucosamine N-acyltransferase [Calditrichota bacterium]